MISIDREAFDTCLRLTNVTLDSGVTRIERRAFAASGLTEITIPDSVTRIGSYAFSGRRSTDSHSEHVFEPWAVCLG